MWIDGNVEEIGRIGAYHPEIAIQLLTELATEPYWDDSVVSAVKQVRPVPGLVPLLDLLVRPRDIQQVFDLTLVASKVGSQFPDSIGDDLVRRIFVELRKDDRHWQEPFHGAPLVKTVEAVLSSGEQQLRHIADLVDSPQYDHLEKYYFDDLAPIGEGIRTFKQESSRNYYVPFYAERQGPRLRRYRRDLQSFYPDRISNPDDSQDIKLRTEDEVFVADLVFDYFKVRKHNNSELRAWLFNLVVLIIQCELWKRPEEPPNIDEQLGPLPVVLDVHHHEVVPDDLPSLILNHRDPQHWLGIEGIETISHRYPRAGVETGILLDCVNIQSKTQVEDSSLDRWEVGYLSERSQLRLGASREVGNYSGPVSPFWRALSTLLQYGDPGHVAGAMLDTLVCDANPALRIVAAWGAHMLVPQNRDAAVRLLNALRSERHPRIQTEVERAKRDLLLYYGEAYCGNSGDRDPYLDLVIRRRTVTGEDGFEPTSPTWETYYWIVLNVPLLYLWRPRLAFLPRLVRRPVQVVVRGLQALPIILVWIFPLTLAFQLRLAILIVWHGLPLLTRSVVRRVMSRAKPRRNLDTRDGL